MTGLHDYAATFVSRNELIELAQSDVNTDLSVVADVTTSLDTTMRYFLAVENHRTRSVIKYIDDLFRLYAPAALQSGRTEQFCFAFEGADLPADVPCVSWQRKAYYSNVLLVPDFYYTLAQGYQNFPTTDLTPWSRRASCAFWRGSTTGGFDVRPDTLPRLLRYQLCRKGIELGSAADFGFYSVVQAASEQDAQLIETRLRKEGLLRDYAPMELYMDCKLLVQIDGNGNSWELIRKLRLNCCMLLVDSEWMLWHNQFLEPWTHYVPVKSDLSNLEDMVHWCLTHDKEAESIANAGRQLALTIDYRSEMVQAVRLIADHACQRALTRPLTAPRVESLDKPILPVRRFRSLLGRYPESEEVVENLRRFEDDVRLINALLQSDEFRRRMQTLRHPSYVSVFDPIKYILQNEDETRHSSSGFVTNFFGVKLSSKYLNGLPGASGEVQDAPIPSNWHAEVAEFGAVLQAVEFARSTFSAVEIGCAWGCWLNISGAVARRKGLTVHLIGVDPDKEALHLAKDTLIANSFTSTEFKLINKFARSKSSLSKPITPSEEGHSIYLDDIFDDLARVDLLHVDVSGGEVDLLVPMLHSLSEKVAYIVVGTNSRVSDGALIRGFTEAGWFLEIERPSLFEIRNGSPSTIMDGVQGWRNPKLVAGAPAAGV